jgi:hypothetical protein
MDETVNDSHLIIPFNILSPPVSHDLIEHPLSVVDNENPSEDPGREFTLKFIHFRVTLT